MSIKTIPALQPHQLSIQINRTILNFESSSELQPYNGVLGQERAITAIQFGVAMDRPGYNIFVMGDQGTGRSSYVQDYLKSEAKRQTAPSEWAYVNNFDNPREPRVLELPAGQGSEFKNDIEKLVDSLLATFPAAFEHPTYQQKKAIIERVFNQQYDKAIDAVEQASLKAGVALYRDAGAISFAPMKDGKPLEEPEFALLDEETRENFHNTIADMETLLNELLIPLPQWKRETTVELRKLNQETIDSALQPLMNPLREKYAGHTGVNEYLAAMQQHLHRIVISELTDDRLLESREESVKRTILEETYVPNLVVNRSATSGAPVVYEMHPSYANLFGRIEYTSEQGALVTSYRKLCPGALHKGNGGYVILDAEKLLHEPFVWEALKRALISRQLKIESPYSEMGLVSTTTLLPEIIPLDIKIILIGSRNTYYLLQDLDDDFPEMFRVLVDFDGYIENSDEQIYAFARLLHSRCMEKNYPSMTRAGVIRMIEYSARLAEDQRHLSARIGDIFELLAEADFTRKLASDDCIDAVHIDRALTAKEMRSGRIQKEILADILDGTTLIDTDGQAIGKINGLTVLSIGDSSFGAPARITATVCPGSRGIVDIERESNLGQNIHTKGVMILTGYLGHKYAQEFPLEVSAHIAMEQSYGYIDGDSASMAEACALVSALSKIPLGQNYAITGSINQYGEVQAIGGINEKIEGFFAVCKARGLTGKQGVIVPHSNVKHLVLKQEVISAVENGQFRIFGVKTVDEALAILTERKVGELSKRGTYPRGSVNARVLERLREIAEIDDDEDDDEPAEKNSKADSDKTVKSDKTEKSARSRKHLQTKKRH